MPIGTKQCHPGLRQKTRLLGLEPLDLLILTPGFFVASVLLQRLGLALVVTGLTGVALYGLKWGKLPGHSMALARYLAFSRCSGVIGGERLRSLRDLNSRR